MGTAGMLDVHKFFEKKDVFGITTAFSNKITGILFNKPYLTYSRISQIITYGRISNKCSA